MYVILLVWYSLQCISIIVAVFSIALPKLSVDTRSSNGIQRSNINYIERVRLAKDCLDISCALNQHEFMYLNLFSNFQYTIYHIYFNMFFRFILPSYNSKIVLL